MRIARLYMDPQDKLRFEIQGKSSVKYHLKANHVVEAKRWFWALNNAIQWSKDEAREEEKKQHRDSEVLRQAQAEQAGKSQHRESDSTSIASSKLGKTLTPTGAISVPGAGGSRSTLVASSFGPESIIEEDESAVVGSYDPSIIANDLGKTISNAETANIEGDMDDEEDYGDDPSINDLQTTNKDAFNITAQSANLQLDLLSQVSAALQTEKSRNSSLSISDPSVVKALLSYDSALVSLKGLIGDLLKMSRDRDAYWQYRLDREADIRRFWEENMARIAKEQEVLQERIGESEDKRRRTKRALKEALGSAAPSAAISRRGSGEIPRETPSISEALEQVPVDKEGAAPLRRKSISATKRRSTIVDLSNISPSDSEDDDDEFFDALDAGEVEVLDKLPTIPAESRPHEEGLVVSREAKKQEITPSFHGYEEPLRKRLKLDADNRPKISLWAILKSMIGKDMTKMTLPVSFNEPTSLLQRVAEDMEYADLLDTAAERLDSTERMVYVAVFAASEYASTIGRVAKPFNPLLGETYEYARPDKGYRFFIEQVSHHPPIGAAYAESPSWDYYGESAVKSKFYGKSFDINPLGTWFLKLRPSSGGEEIYTWKKVTSSVVGIITGNPTVDNYGPMEVKNWKTGDVCILDFKPRGWKASSAYQVTGKVTGADGKTRWSIGGRWNDKIYARLTPGFEDDLDRPSSVSVRSQDAGSTQAFLVWQCHERPSGIPFNLTPFVLTLNALPESLRPVLAPTDTRLRPDQRAMEDGEYDFAAVEKNRVEEKQRKKRREREASGEDHKPRWFTKGRCEITGEPYWVFNDQYWRMRDEVAKGGSWEKVEDIF
ncbi:hypothetical protein L228DRAFT_90195 [Xylona heveae TC161]|uniref:PH domain-containing protein n=1 Tax=Xylona heveae (strain CBS 132557 / TC161) TaxID=1328760 RepID=A0A165HZB5_XYLHT|nr:hypothetical protein L228DRAFT_90195 [Xylona heveae TC161]KZF24131.1 hypothetical protein L228DRAFT_90195 [Xylona heveae TC161]